MKIQIGLLGLGTIGSGFLQMLEAQREHFQRLTDYEVSVAKVLVRDLNKKRKVVLPSEVFTTDADEIIYHPDIQIVIEVVGGVDRAKDYIERALRNKKHVITANKDVMAAYGAELLALAKENGCDLLYEASVAGGIPIIRGLVEGLASDRIHKILGIVNGTTNYILTKMSTEGMDYSHALSLAQKLGFAEPDPTSDVEGLDAARKILILSNIAFAMNLTLSDVQVKGISSITQEDIQYADQLGYAIKLIGLAERNNDAVEVSVQPTLIPTSHPLASVHNEFNAVYVTGEAVGETMFYGKGAGALPTATSIGSDLIAVMKNIKQGTNSLAIRTHYTDKNLQKPENTYSKFFMRMHVKDEVGVFSKIASLFLKYNLSFENILQKPFIDEKGAEIIIITHEVCLQCFMDSLNEIQNMEEVIDIKNFFRVL